MRLFAPSLAFVDLETTGTLAAADAITEVGDRPGRRPSRRHRRAGGQRVEHARQSRRRRSRRKSRRSPASPTRWSATRRASAASPTKSPRAPRARFSSRTTRASTTASSSTRSRALERRFSARVLCTVRLSRRLFPDEPRHNLDSVIARHGLPLDGRHRALGDARVLWAFVRALYRDLAARDDRAGRPARPADAEPAAAARRPMRSTRCPKRPAFTFSTGSTRCRSTSARARTCASASARISRPITARRPIFGSRRKSSGSNSRKRRARSARCCAKRRS